MNEQELFAPSSNCIAEASSDTAPMSEEKIKEGISCRKWYQPISFGRGVHADAWGRPHMRQSYLFGLSKWRYIVERNLPDLQGLRVLDIGCNAGLFSIQLARCGASEVVGIDSEATWPGWRDQACFVKEALEWRCKTTYNVSFVDCPMTDIPTANLGRFDLAISLCSLYYVERPSMLQILRYFRETECPHVVLQANKQRLTQSREVRRRAAPRFLRGVLDEAGYPYISMDRPILYSRPIIAGRLQVAPLPQSDRRTRLRRWFHRLL